MMSKYDTIAWLVVTAILLLIARRAGEYDKKKKNCTSICYARQSMETNMVLK